PSAWSRVLWPRCARCATPRRMRPSAERMPHELPEHDHPAPIRRMAALLEVLRDGPLDRRALLARLGDAYPQTGSARRMVDRDIEYLASLGIVVERSQTRPPVYTLHGGTPIFVDEDLRALALIRDSFGDRHPQAAIVRSLLERLTRRLDE